jgi:putative redox protein
MYTASAQSVDGTPRHHVNVNGRHTLVTDTASRLGGTDDGPSPHELLPATLASCVSTMIVLYARRHDWQVDDVRVEVSYDPDARPRRFDTAVHLPEGLSGEQIDRLRRVAETCPVRRAIESGFRFRDQFEQDLSAREATAAA